MININSVKKIISIITINYNNKKGLEKTIKSVINQTHHNLEYIIIDGGSMDGSIDIIKQHKTIISYWVSEPDYGVYDAMNKGLLKATGEYIFFLNSGDLFENRFVLEKVEKELRKNSVDILYGNVIDEDVNGKRSKRQQLYLSKVNLYYKMICHQSIFAKKDLFIKNGLFDLQYKIKSDYDWLLKNIFLNASHRHINWTICIYKGGGLSERHYDTVSVHEIPLIHSKYYSKKTKYILTKFIINPRITKYTKTHLKSAFFLKLIDKII